MVAIKTDGIKGLLNEIIGKKLVCFGAGKHFDTVMQQYQSWNLKDKVTIILDNYPENCGGIKVYESKQYTVINPEQFFDMDEHESIVILVTSHLYSMEIVKQLDRYSELDGISVYVGSFLSDVYVNVDTKLRVQPKSNQVIPKVIHYCWFGDGPIPEEYLRYMESWRKKCPDYEVKRWDESNFDVTQNTYMKQAYENKKWAFVSDYARLKVVHDEGGIYLDCDVELIKSLDSFLGEELFCGFEDLNHINLGLGFGAVKEHPYLKALMDYYGTLDFINQDGSLNLVPCPSYQTYIMRQFGIRDNNTYQSINGVTVYPVEVFAPLSAWGSKTITENTYSIHHYGASWQSKEVVRQISDMYEEYVKRVYKQEWVR